MQAIDALPLMTQGGSPQFSLGHRLQQQPAGWTPAALMPDAEFFHKALERMKNAKNPE
jgi:hypothetical protein